ncbi:MAG TPA: DUF916 domain-containing protein [Actinomycetota bacterium]|nr:DUF916 domain-containing protein [Actinomycetota bacterium]
MQTKTIESRSLRAALVVATLLALGHFSPALGGETETFGISPHPEFKQGLRRSFRFGLSPGSSAKDSVRVYNKTDRALKLVVHASDASRSADGTIHIPPTGSRPDSVGTWLRLDANELTLEAKQQKTLSFTVSQPKGSRGGGLAAIVAEEADSSARSGESVEIVTRVALLVRVGEVSEADVTVGSVALRPVVRFVPETAEVSTEVSNQTDRPVTLRVAGEVRSLTGRKFKLEERSIELQAQQTRRVTLPWDTVPRFGGVMRATVRGTYTEGEVSSRSSMTPIVPVWLLMLVIGIEGWILAKKLRRGGG